MVTDAQLRMLTESGEDSLDGRGFGVELRGAGDWKTARNLVAQGLGWIEGYPGGELPGMYFSNAEGVQAYRSATGQDEREELGPWW